MSQIEALQKQYNEKGADAYEPARIPKEKYAKIVEGRNRFFIATIGGIALFMGATAIPQFLMYRSLRRVYQRCCRGKVLDLSPKLYDEKDVAFYEMSKAVRVEYLVDRRVVDDGRYKIDESLSEAEKEENRRAMTLDFMLKNDHNWVGSTVNFAIIERAETQQPSFQKYHSVVIRDELMNHNTIEARKIFDSAARFLDKDGNFLVMDFGKSSYKSLDRFARWFNARTNSSMSFTHDYHQWIEESMLYEVVEERRCLMGFHYAMVLRLRGEPVQPRAFE